MKTPEQEIREGREAQTIYDHPLVKGAFDGVEAGIIQAMRKAPLGDTATHHELVVTLQLLGSLRQQFITMIQTGTMAEKMKESNGRK